jgi:TolB protein
LTAVAAALALSGCAGASQVSAAAQAVSRPCPAQEYWGVFWSPDSRKLAAMIYMRGQDAQLYAIDLPSMAARPVASSFQGVKSDPRWSPDSRQIVFTSRYQNKFELFVVSSDGVSVRQITHNKTNNVLPAWSPDGSRLAYLALDRLSAHTSTIFTINPDGSDERVVIAERNLIHDLAWSPDGSQLAYALGVGRSTITTITPDGSRKTRLTDGQGDDRALNWSADSRRIAFVSYRGGQNGMYVINADGSSLKRLTTDFDERARPAWLPDGRHISYVSHGPTTRLMLIDADTGLSESLNPLEVEEYYYPPSWSLDGSKAAFIAYDHSNPSRASLEIYTINHDGSGLARLTDNPGKYRCFHWPF